MREAKQHQQQPGQALARFSGEDLKTGNALTLLTGLA
jgi:hypothetical protein